jgi:hypothetical protein
MKERVAPMGSRMSLINSPWILRVTGLLAIAALAGCATSQAMIGKARPPISSDEVRIYLEPPAARYDKIAFIESSSKRSLAWGGDAKTEVVIQRLKRAAAKLGANGVLLQSMGDQAAASVGGVVGTTHESSRGTVDLGVGSFTTGDQKAGSGLAIYVEPDATP